MMPSLEGLLLGRDSRLTAKLFVVTILLTVLVQSSYQFYSARTVSGIVSFPELLLVPMVVPAFLHAYWNDGLVPCATFGAVVGLGQNLYLYVFDVDPPYRSGPDSLAGVVTSTELLAVGVVYGAVAFVVGAGLGILVGAVHSKNAFGDRG